MYPGLSLNSPEWRRSAFFDDAAEVSDIASWKYHKIKKTFNTNFC